MFSDDAQLVIAQVGFTGSDADRERLLLMELWLEGNDAAFATKLRTARAAARITEDFFDLNFDPPRDFLFEQTRADVVVIHNLCGFSGGGRGKGATAVSAMHEVGNWNRRLVATGARHIFVFGPDFDPEPEGYHHVDDLSMFHLIVWTKIQTARHEPITVSDLTAARLARLAEFTANETLDLSHVAAITPAQLATIAQMPNLRHLLLSGVTATDAEIAAMLSSGCRALRSLYVDRTSVGSISLQALSSCKELTLLSLNDTLVGGVGLTYLRDLPRLETLSLVNTNVGSADIAALSALHSLRMLALTGSRLSRLEVGLLASALPDCVIDMADEATT